MLYNFKQKTKILLRRIYLRILNCKIKLNKITYEVETNNNNYFKHSLPKDINTYQVGKILRNISDELDGVQYLNKHLPNRLELNVIEQILNTRVSSRTFKIFGGDHMWHEKFTNKHGETKYRYYEKYKDPLTNKWRRTSVVLNKNGKQSQKEAQKRLNERIEAKLNDKTPTNLKR